ncbi:uroporphyrinogen-III C-methyltransferase [Rhodothalassium salexigens]|uniref:siroheme synthase CysG n=2 Tax=Rhodothalassium salexigens TaxID=1086 RepID=UPI001912A432|nr:siroheme synthase CysG [Rhodothalassium salexigens]MBK5920252.1 uroporphyrinogen-III C-methyltransferase [Rhodothalassium salexigens]
MRTLPINVRLDGRTVLVVGDGEAAHAKLRLLAKTPARLRVVAPDGWAGLGDWRGRVEVTARAFEPADLAGVALVYAATEDAATDSAVAAAARAAGVPVNVVDRPALCDFITPAIVDRDPLSIAICTNGGAPVLGRRLRARIEAWLPQGFGRLVDNAAGFRDRLKAVLPEVADRRRFWDRFFDGAAGDDLLALSDDALGARLERLAQTAAAERDQGKAAGEAGGEVLLVGAGPGDPELLTLKAHRALQQADVIIYDRLVSEDVLDYARRDARFVHVGKRAGHPSWGQAAINDLLIREARAGNRVVRLKSGDPFVFGRAGEEVEDLTAAGVAVSVVPGVTAAAGCAAHSLIPLTHRDHASAVTLVTGQLKGGGAQSWRGLYGPGRTLAVYMGVTTARDIAQGLIADGAPAALPVAIIERGTQAGERRVYGRLVDLPDLVAVHAIESPAMLVIGEVARLARDWPAEALAPLFAEASNT